MKRSGKILAICFSLIVLTLHVRAEGIADNANNDFSKNNTGNSSLVFSPERIVFESPGEQTFAFSGGPNALPVIHMKKSQKEISLTFLEPRTKKVKSEGSRLPYFIEIIPTITIRDIIFPSHYFL
jgi:hypothetical protein